jgi:broad specificity phosphatase PhoE/cation transport regulator ChaB
LALNQQKTYSQPELQEVVNQFQQLYENLRVMHLDDKQVKTPMRVTNFDEEIKHLIPDLKTLFQTELFEQAERNILSGLGFIDIVQGVVSNRRESVLNPKAFIEEVNSAIADFKQILNTLLYLIAEKNDSHIKYNASKLYISSTPVRSFMTDDFKDKLRTLYDRGGLSKRTFVELVGEVDYDTEKFRRENEAKQGDEYIMYPQLTQNVEDKGLDIHGQPTAESTGKPAGKSTEGKNGKEVPQDRTGVEAENWNYATEELSNEDDAIISPEVVESEADEDILELAKKSDKKDDTLLYVVRHGKTALNAKDTHTDRIRGWQDVDLDPKGIEEAKKIAKKFEKVSVGKIYSSDLKRAVDTADEIAKVKKMNVRETQALRPMHLGEFEGKISADVTNKVRPYVEDYPDEAIKDGESFDNFKERFLSFLKNQIETANKDKKNVLVTHYRDIRLMKAWLKAGGKDDIDVDEFMRHDPNDGTAVVLRLYKTDDGYGLEEASYKVRETEQYIRYRQIDPKKFEKDSFRTIILSPSKGIKAIVGRLHGKKTTTVQAYLFKKDKWNQSDSKAWVEKNHPNYSATVGEVDLVTAPYKNLKELPPAVKKMPEEHQKAWRSIWNNAYRYMLAKTGNAKNAETYAFRVAYSKSKLVKSNLSIWERLANKFKK